MGTYILHPGSIRQLFDSVAPHYDFLNHILSLRRDIFWRKTAVRELQGTEGWILDIATGTGDIAIEIVRHEAGKRKVVGLDFSSAMIRVAQEKVLKGGGGRAIHLGLGDGISLPFRKDTFGAAIIAFGLRNIPDKAQALAEMIRVTRKGGKVVVLEFTFPREGLMKRVYPYYFMRVLPWVGGLISGDQGAYTYLPQSVSHFPSSEQYEDLMRRSGLEQVTSRTLTFGIASLLVGWKRGL
jgi:demethylmenaquinone methyltransferase / 2-methoxy-6-polyprenyl-1,4-benzoquinol methylase